MLVPTARPTAAGILHNLYNSKLPCKQTIYSTREPIQIARPIPFLKEFLFIYGFSKTRFRSDDDADLIDIENYAIENLES